MVTVLQKMTCVMGFCLPTRDDIRATTTVQFNKPGAFKRGMLSFIEFHKTNSSILINLQVLTILDI